MGKGSSTTTSTQTANPQAVSEANNAYGAASTAASAPYQYYPGQLVANLNSDQQQAIGTVANSQGIANPYINAASDLTSAATQPIGASQINQYMNPYISDVANTTSAEINQNNAVQQNQLQGNAAALGALGGNRVGIAQAALANQQDMAENSTISNLYSSGYNTALGAAQTQNSQDLQGAYEYGNLGTTAQNAALTGANAQLETGGIEQQQQQNVLNQAYGQWEGAQQYPFQTGEYLSNVASSLAPIYGGTSSTTLPAPSTFSQVVGGIGAVAGIAGSLKSGGRVGRAGGGAVNHQMTLGDLIHYMDVGHAVVHGRPHYDDGGWVQATFGGPPPPPGFDPNKGTDGAGKASGGRIGYDDGGTIPYQTGPVSGQDEVGNTKHYGYIPQQSWVKGRYGGPSAPQGDDPNTDEESAKLTGQDGKNLANIYDWFTGAPGTQGIGDSMGDTASDASMVAHQGAARGGRQGYDDGGWVPGRFGGPPPPAGFDPNAGTDGSQKQSSGGGGSGGSGLGSLMKVAGMLGYAAGGRTGLASGGTAASNSSATPGSTTNNGTLTGLSATLTGSTPTEGQSIENYQFISPLIATGHAPAAQQSQTESPQQEEQGEEQEVASMGGLATGGRAHRTAGGVSTAATVAPQLPTPQYAGAGLTGNAPQPTTTAGTNPTAWGNVQMPSAPQQSAPQGAAPGTGTLAALSSPAASNFISSYKGSQDPYTAYIESMAGSNPSISEKNATTAQATTPKTAAMGELWSGENIPQSAFRAAGGRTHYDIGGDTTPTDLGGLATPTPVTAAPLAPPANWTPSPQWVASVDHIESGGNPTASNPNSSSAGLGGLTTPTMAALAPNMVNGKTPAQITAEKDTPATSNALVADLATQNATYLKNNGLPVNDGTVYLAHNFGAGGAKALLTADPSTPVEKVLPDEDIKANPDLAGKTAGQVVQSRMSEITGATGGGTQVAQNDTQQPAYATGQTATDLSALPQIGADQDVNSAVQGISNENNDLTNRSDTTVDKISNSPWMALAEAGLATMAGTSPFAAVNIGAGGLAGIQYLQNTQGQERANTAQTANIQQNQAELQQRAVNQLMQAAQTNQSQEGILNNLRIGLINSVPGITDSAINAITRNIQSQAYNSMNQGAPGYVPQPMVIVPQADLGGLSGNNSGLGSVGATPQSAPVVPQGAQGIAAAPAATAQTAAPAQIAAGTVGTVPSNVPAAAQTGPMILGPNNQPMGINAAKAMAQMAVRANLPGASDYLNNLNGQISSGKITDINGNVVPVPGFNATNATQTAANAEATSWTNLNDTQAVNALNVTQQQLTEMANAGYNAPIGKYSGVESNMASTLQALSQITRIPISGKITDAASGADLIDKISTQLTASLTAGMGQTAQASLAQISHAVPNRSLSSAQSYYGLIRSTAQQIQLAKDMRNFGNQPAGNGMTMRQAIQAQNPNNPYAWQDAFVQNHPPEMYTSRVQPLLAPVDAKGNVDATKLQNGFDYQINGNVFQATPNGPAAVDELGNAAQ